MVTYNDTKKLYAKLTKVVVTILLTVMFGQLYFQPETAHTSYIDRLFETSELAQAHRDLGHASAESVYSALRRAYSIEAGVSDLENLIETKKQCRGCGIFSKQPYRYRAVYPQQSVFNFDVAIEVMFIPQVHVLYAACKQAQFSPATVLIKQDSFRTWTAFMTMWVIPYLGVPYNLLVDRAWAFLSTQLTTLAYVLECKVVPVAVEAHWTLIAERYYDALRRIVNKLIVDHPAASLSLIGN